MYENIIFIDCDSTLSAIEGIDELARLRGEETFEACKNMTNRAMDGEIAIEAVYGERLKLINPTREECEAIGQMYIDTIEPGAKGLVEWLGANGWLTVIVSGGITQVIEPFARHLGVEELKAVDVFFDGEGKFEGFLDSAPTARVGGKIEVIDEYKKSHEPKKVVMVGDGVSDLETQGNVDLFVGFGGFVERVKVKGEAKAFVKSLADLPPLLTEL
ncbi:MAG: HAD-IB family phosphatase [Verrucomicrobiota bacterium]